MGVFELLRRDELINLTIHDRRSVVIKIWDTKIGGAKSFSVVKENEMSALFLCEKYAFLRPNGIRKRRFSLGKQSDWCNYERFPNKILNSFFWPGVTVTFFKKLEMNWNVLFFSYNYQVNLPVDCPSSWTCVKQRCLEDATEI